ncbi:MAG TPA: hypothetical protein VMG08_12000 [Allosphingosinicella sp.]|nr:hypothetical protein [Allosphingosinicella sp.]
MMLRGRLSSGAADGPQARLRRRVDGAAAARGPMSDAEILVHSFSLIV